MLKQYKTSQKAEENGCWSILKKSCEHLIKEQKHKVWQGGYHAEIVQSNWFIKQKINYIHNNPVKEKIVAFPEDYYFSSARNYAGLDYELEVIALDLF